MNDVRSSAFHQAGHAVMSWLSKMEVRPLSITARGKPVSCIILPSVKPTGDVAIDQLFAWKEEREAAVRIILAGVMAQDIATSARRSDFETEHDFEKARKLVAEISGTYSELIAYLQLLCVQTHDLLGANWARVDAVATALLARKNLGAGEAAAIILAVQPGAGPGTPKRDSLG